MAFTTIPGSGSAATTLAGTSGIDSITINSDLTTNVFVGAQPAADVVNLGGAISRSNFTIKGGQGTDTFGFGGGSLTTSFLNGNADADTFGTVNDRVALVTSTLKGGAGADSIFLSSVSGSIVNGNKQGDTINLSGNASSSSIYGGAADDSIVIGAAASLANTLVKGDKGDDTFTVSINASQGFSSTNSTLQGAEGKDTINASLATAAIVGAGGLGSDSLEGGSNTDTLNGGIGADTLEGNAGVDALSGGNGDDQFVYTVATELFNAANAIEDVINGGTGTDAIAINNGAVAFQIDGADTFAATQISGVSTIRAFAAASAAIDIELDADAATVGLTTVDLSADTDATGNNSVNVADVGAAFTVLGSAGADTEIGGAAAESLSGAAGADSLSGAASTDSLSGGAGTDTLSGGAGNDTVASGDGADVLSYGSNGTTNGTDSYTDSTIDGGGDILNTLFGDGGLANNAALRGNGTVAQRLAAGAALGANTGFVIASADIADAAEAETYAEGLTGEGANDIVYLLASTDANADATATLYTVTYAGAGNAALVSLGTFDSITVDNVANGNLADFTL